MLQVYCRWDVLTPRRPITAGAEPGQFPFAAALHAGSPNDGGLSQYCGGALVAENLILTAGSQ